jgi:hypothetical protein
MKHQLRLTASRVLNDPNARVIFVLSTMLVAILVGAAPNDHG